MNTRIPTTMYALMDELDQRQDAREAAKDVSAARPVIAAHVLKRESTGTGMADTCCPTCSCGWRGIAIPEYEDYQMTEVQRQEREHITQSQLTAKEPA